MKYLSVQEAEILKKDKVDPLMQEANELFKIITRSIKTLKDFDAVYKAVGVGKLELTGGFHVLKGIPPYTLDSGTKESHYIGGMFIIEPFLLEGANYLSIAGYTADGSGKAWHVISKFNLPAELEDICYFSRSDIPRELN